jgi:hypothetical protein
MKNTLKMFTFVFVALALMYAPAAKAVSFAPAFESDAVSESSTLELQPLAFSTDYEIAGTDAQVLPSQQFALTLTDETYRRVSSGELSLSERPTPNFVTFLPVRLPLREVLSPTPEPMSLMLFATGLAGIGLMLRRFVA